MVCLPAGIFMYDLRAFFYHCFSAFAVLQRKKVESRKVMAVCVLPVLSVAFDCFICRPNVVVTLERCYNIYVADN